MNAAKHTDGGGNGDEFDAAVREFLKDAESAALLTPAVRAEADALASFTHQSLEAIKGGAAIRPVLDQFEAYLEGFSVGSASVRLDIIKEARLSLGLGLVRARKFEAASLVATKMSTPEGVCGVWALLGVEAMERDAQLGATIVEGMFSIAVIELYHTDITKGVGFLHLMRRTALVGKPDVDKAILFGRTSDWLGHMSGEGYDEIRDWFEAESAVYPDVEWEAIVSVVERS